MAVRNIVSGVLRKRGTRSQVPQYAQFQSREKLLPYLVSNENGGKKKLIERAEPKTGGAEPEREEDVLPQQKEVEHFCK